MRERQADQFEEGIRKKYSTKLSKQEALIMKRLEKEGGFYFFEHGGGGIAKNDVMEAELKGREDIIIGMKDMAMEVQVEREELIKRKLEVDQQKRDIDSIIRKEKSKRYNG